MPAVFFGSLIESFDDLILSDEIKCTKIDDELCETLNEYIKRYNCNTV